MTETLLIVNFTGDPSPHFGYSVFYRSFDLTDNTPVYTFHSTVNSDGGAQLQRHRHTSAEDMDGYQDLAVQARGAQPVHAAFRFGVNGGQPEDDLRRTGCTTT